MERWIGVFAAMALLVVGACGGGGTAGDGGDGGAGGGAGRGGDGEDACVPRGATVVVEPWELGEGVLRRIAVDEERIFVGTLYDIRSAPRAGGESRQVFSTKEIAGWMYPAFWLQGDRLLVGLREELRVLPKEGGAAISTMTLPAPFSSSLDGSADIILDQDGRTFFGKNDPLVLSGKKPAIAYFSFDTETKGSTILLEGVEIGHHKEMVRAGSYLYTAHRTGDPDPSSEDPDELYRIPVAGGAAEKVPLGLDLHFDLLGADDTHLFLAGTVVPTDYATNPPGVYRMPLEGGMPERIVNTYPIMKLVRSWIEMDDHHLLWSVDQVFRIAKGSGEAVQLTRSRCIHAIAASGSDVYLGLFNEKTGMASVARVANR